jgi:hypothetical protein
LCINQAINQNISAVFGRCVLIRPRLALAYASEASKASAGVGVQHTSQLRERTLCISAVFFVIILKCPK